MAVAGALSLVLIARAAYLLGGAETITPEVIVLDASDLPPIWPEVIRR